MERVAGCGGVCADGEEFVGASCRVQAHYGSFKNGNQCNPDAVCPNHPDVLIVYLI